MPLTEWWARPPPCWMSLMTTCQQRYTAVSWTAAKSPWACWWRKVCSATVAVLSYNTQTWIHSKARSFLCSSCALAVWSPIIKSISICNITLRISDWRIACICTGCHLLSVYQKLDCKLFPCAVELCNIFRYRDGNSPRSGGFLGTPVMLANRTLALCVAHTYKLLKQTKSIVTKMRNISIPLPFCLRCCTYWVCRKLWFCLCRLATGRKQGQKEDLTNTNQNN